MDGHLTAATESRATAAIIIRANLVRVDALGHLYNIVRRARILENAIEVTQDSKLK
jgi:hypothetical protein